MQIKGAKLGGIFNMDGTAVACKQRRIISLDLRKKNTSRVSRFHDFGLLFRIFTANYFPKTQFTQSHGRGQIFLQLPTEDFAVRILGK